MVQLQCKIDSVTHEYETPSYSYSIWNGENRIFGAISSSLDWVRHDAKGYHTKEQFDKLYPYGWNVNFDFDM